MRSLVLLLPILFLAACGGPGGSTVSGPVDAASLPPLSGKEQALLVAANGALRTHDAPSAIRDYQTAIALSQGHIDAHLGLARLYLSQQKPALAQSVLERALVLQPQHAEANYLLGKLHIGAGRAQEAADAFARGLTAAPGNFDLLNGSGIAHDMLRQHVRAQHFYQRAIAQHPSLDLSMLRTNLAMSYLLSGEPKKAVEQLKDEAKKPAAAPVTRHNLALAYGMLGRHAEAKKLLGTEMTESERTQALERLRNYIAAGGN